MMLDKKKPVLLFILTVISFIVLILAIFSRVNESKNKDNKYEVTINSNNKIVNIMDFTINPGEKVEFKVETKLNEKINAKVEVYFENVSYELKDALVVYAIHNNQKTEKSFVYNCIETNKMKFNTNLDRSNNYFILVFEMPMELGNEYQNKQYDFDTWIIVKG